jgi:RNA recognition motif-containing protein
MPTRHHCEHFASSFVCHFLEFFLSVLSNETNICREPRGFAFVEFVDPYDASEAQYHMNRQVFFGREIAVVLAAESRKRPEEMRSRTRVRYDLSFCCSSMPLFLLCTHLK